jgi:tRNA A22 N-methylase
MENIMNEEEKIQNFIHIEFEDEHSAIFNIKFENVVPGQLLAVASYLDFEGRNQLALQKAAQMQAEIQKQQREKIVIPKPKVEL